MPDEMNPNDPRSLWQGQEVEKVVLSINEVRQRAGRFERRIRRRNALELVAGTFVVFVGTQQVWRADGWRATPPALAIVGTLYMLFQLHRRGRARSLPAEVGTRGSIEFYRVELERQRDAARGMWHWYLLPFAPSLVGGLVVAGVDRGIDARWIGMAAVFVLLFVGTWALNQRGARKLDRKIQDSKALEADSDN